MPVSYRIRTVATACSTVHRNYKRNSLQDVIAAKPATLEPDQQADVVQQQQQQDNDGGDSLTSSLAIEGFVQGASEDFTVQSQTAAYEVDEV